MSRRLLMVLCLFLYSLPSFSRIVVISDIDDTLKKSNSVGKPFEQAYHFLRKIPYFEMRDLFNEMKADARKKNEGIRYYYVSAAYNLTFNAQSWISKHHFPAGESFLKTSETKAPTYEFKYKTIKAVLEKEKKKLAQGEPLKVYLFGDNAQVDHLVYSDLKRDMLLDAEIYIRDVRTEATFFDSTLPVKQHPGVQYFFSEVELFALPSMSFVSDNLRLRTLESYKKRELIPEYTLKTFERRLEDLYGDEDRAEDDAAKYWSDYYSRF